MKRNELNKETKYQIKESLYLGLALLVLVFFISFAIGFVYDDYEGAVTSFLSLLWFPFMGAVPTIIKSYIYGKETMDYDIQNDNLVRDIPKEIPPAIASMLVDSYIESEQDYLATIANLISKNYIEVEEKREYDLKVTVKNTDLSGLMEHERFAFICVTQGIHFEPKEFENKVISDAKNINLIKIVKNKETLNNLYKKHMFFCLIFSILLVVGFYGGINILAKLGSLSENKIVIFIFGLIEFILFCMIYRSQTLASFYSKQKSEPDFKFMCEKTQRGKEYAEKFLGLKNYLKEYTLVKEKNLDGVKLYDEYIAYAIALGEADKLEKLIETDFSLAHILLRIKYYE